MKATDEKSRIRGSGSASKCHGYTTMVTARNRCCMWRIRNDLSGQRSTSMRPRSCLSYYVVYFYSIERPLLTYFQGSKGYKLPLF
jgi:hypothetical protein